MSFFWVLFTVYLTGVIATSAHGVWACYNRDDWETDLRNCLVESLFIGLFWPIGVLMAIDVVWSTRRHRR